MEFIKTATFVLGSNIVTIDDTDEIIAGLNAYSSLLPVGTKVNSIVDGTHLQLSNNALDNGDATLKLFDMIPYKVLERNDALKEVQDIVNAEGVFVHIILRGESNVTQDEYKSVKNKAQLKSVWLKAFPIIDNPSKNEIDKIGLKEDTEIVIYTSMKDWIDKGYSFDDISLEYSTVKYDGATYKIRDKKRLDKIGNQYLYIVLGLKSE